MSAPYEKKEAFKDRLPPPFRTVVGILYEWMGALRLAGDGCSLARLFLDILLFRLLGLFDLPGRDRERRVRLRGGIAFTYRLNRGDIQSIREVWIDEAYKLPFALSPVTVIDLGANIGLTSLWLAHRYGVSRIVAVEPCPANARLARLNLAGTRIRVDVIQAAVGPRDGVALLEGSADSNIGRVGATGVEVPMISMPRILDAFPPGDQIDLMKMDIEGSEQALLTGDIRWLERIRSIVAEFHPNCVDYPGLIARLEAAGFRYLRPSRTGAMDAFIRTPP